MRHERIHTRALFIDEFVGAYQKVRNRKTFPHKEVGRIIHFLFPDCSYKGRGAFKTVHKISTRARDLVLKTSSPKNIKKDMRVYCRIPEPIRNRYFAKIYWSTKCCLLQKYGRKTRALPAKALKRLQDIGKKHGLTDIRPDNVRKVGNQFKIVDASVRRRRW